MPISGIDDAIGELAARDDRMGFKTVQLINFPNGGRAPKPEDDRFWEKSLELGMAHLAALRLRRTRSTMGEARHDTSQWPAEAGMTQHAQARVRATRWRR